MIMPASQVYQFKITLERIKPEIWRRIQVPADYSFWDLHVAIQDSMGWEDSHLHEWITKDESTGEDIHLGIYPNEFDDYPVVIMDWKVPIRKFFREERDFLPYRYDFGDSWRHMVQLEKILTEDANQDYPVCIAGERACPPEDVGGPRGYQEFLQAIRDPSHEEHQEWLTWAGGSFDPELFKPDQVHFDNPKKRWKKAFSGDPLCSV